MIHQTPAPAPVSNLRSPDSLDGLSETDIVGLEFIKSNTDRHSGSLQQPLESLSRLWYAVFWKVIGDAGLEADVGVDEDGGAEDGIHGWVQGAGDERSDCEWDEADRDGALEGPVVGAVHWVRFWDLGSIVG